MSAWWRLTYAIAKWRGEHTCERRGHRWEPLSEHSDMLWCGRCWLTRNPVRANAVTNQTWITL